MIDLASATTIGRTELDREFGSSAAEWACEWEWDELTSAWILYVDRVDYYKTKDASKSVPSTAPIVISKADGAVTRPFSDRSEAGRIDRIGPGEKCLAFRRFPSDYDTAHDRLPDSMLFAHHTLAEWRSWLPRLTKFVLVLPAPKDMGGDSFEVAIPCADPDEVRERLAMLELVEDDELSGTLRRGTEGLVTARVRNDVIRLSVCGLTGSMWDVGEPDVELCVQLEQKFVEWGWDSGIVRAGFRPIWPPSVVTSERYPEIFD